MGTKLVVPTKSENDFVLIDNDVLGKFANEKLKIKFYLFLFRSSCKLCVEQTPVDEKNEGREKTILKSCKFYYWKKPAGYGGTEYSK